MSLTFKEILHEMQNRKLDALPVVLADKKGVLRYVVDINRYSKRGGELLYTAIVSSGVACYWTEREINEWRIVRHASEKKLKLYSALFKVDSYDPEEESYHVPDMLFKDNDHAIRWGKRCARTFVRLLTDRPVEV